MNSLEKICLYSVARNASCYEIEDFEALNVYVLEQLVSYLSAYQLNRLHNVFIRAGVEVERVWKRHLALHWNSAFDFPAAVFNSDSHRGSRTEPRRVYLERLFQKVISNLDSGTDEPQYIAKLKRLPRCRHGICYQCLDSTALDNSILKSELPLYAVHVRVLSIAATSPMIQYLLKDRSLLGILQRTVSRLDTHYINALNFNTTRELVRLLVQEGSVSEFSVFKARLPSGLLENLLMLVSGQQTEPYLGSISSVDDRPIADVGRKRFVEGETCTSTEYDDIDIPHTTKVDESKTLSSTDETSRTSSQGYEDYVVGDLEVVDDDDDLYNVALSTSGSNANSLGNGLSLSIPEDSLRNVSDSSGATTIKPTGCSASSLHLGNSQSECAIFNSETSSTFGAGSLSASRSVLPPRSCTSFTLGCYSGLHTHDGLFRVLRKWTALQRLALFEVSDCWSYLSCPCGHSVNFTIVDQLRASAEGLPVGRRSQDNKGDDLGYVLYKAILNNQLTHIVSIDVDLGIDVFHIIACALLRKQNNRPLKEVKISLDPHEDPTRFPALLNSTVEFYGTVCLDFNGSEIVDVTTSEMIMSWIRGDRALKCLHLPSFDDAWYLTETLQILACNQRIEELHINREIFDARSISSLISVLQSCSSLRKLNLADCELSKNQVEGKLFVEAISMHPTLTDLNLQQNYLEDVGCDLLKAICLRKAFFNSLDLSFNRIEGKLLFDTCLEIQTELRKRNRSTFPLSELNLSGNIFHLKWRNRLVQTLVDCVNVFVVLDPNLGNPAGSLADHISQM